MGTLNLGKRLWLGLKHSQGTNTRFLGKKRVFSPLPLLEIPLFYDTPIHPNLLHNWSTALLHSWFMRTACILLTSLHPRYVNRAWGKEQKHAATCAN